MKYLGFEDNEIKEKFQKNYHIEEKKKKGIFGGFFGKK